MKRSQQERSVSTITRLKRATVSLIAERGYASITTNEIAQRAGVSRGALLHHYPLKIDLIVDAAQDVWREAAIQVRRLAEELCQSGSNVDAFVDRMWDHVFREEAVKMTIDLMSAAQADASLRSRLDPHLRQLFDSYGEIADQAFTGCGMSRDERLTLVSFATCAIRGLRVQDIMTHSPGMTKAVLRELKAHLKMSLDRGTSGREPGPERVPTAPPRSVLIRARTDSKSSKRVWLKELRYSLIDFDSIRLGDSQGTRNSPMATTGLPCGVSQESS